MPRREREFLRDKLRLLTRRVDNAPSLLARLVDAGDSFQDTSTQLPEELDARADASDKLALGVARDAAALAAIGRAVYGALVEQLLARDGGPDGRTFRDQLHTPFEQFGEAAAHCDLNVAEELLSGLPRHVKTVLRETQAYVRGGKPEKFSSLHDCYQTAEVQRKNSRRARLLDTARAAQRRAEWNPQRHNTTPLHYRWRIVRKMLSDLST